MENNTVTLFGEVLIDRLPDGKTVLGGAPFNVAWHLQAFGQNPHLISRVGNDKTGIAIQTAMHNWGLNTDFLQHDSVYPTGEVQVSIENGEPSYKILSDQAYDYIEKQFIENINRTSILYHGTLATRSYTSKQTLLKIKILHLGKIFVDVNLRHPWWDKDEVIDLLSYTDCIKLNLYELDALETTPGDLKSRMDTFLDKYQLETVIVTCGNKGAFALLKNGEFYSISPAKSSAKLVDTVGSGDAFSAVVLLGLTLDWEFGLIMERAQTFASELTKKSGAIVDNMKFYNRFMKAWDLTA